MGTRIEEMQLGRRQTSKPFNEMPFLIDHRRLAQRPDGNRQMRRPCLANGLKQVLITRIQMLPEQA